MDGSEARLPVGTRILVKKIKKSDKQDRKFHGMAGTVIDYGHSASKWDHLVQLDDWDMNRWFSIDELERKEG